MSVPEHGGQTLLSRYAEAAFWLGRYVERAENLARILDVNETFAHDDDEAASWTSIVELNADSDRFSPPSDDNLAEAVIRFYTLDSTNETSIIWSIKAARENARTVRPLISTEMWSQINRFHNRLIGMTWAEVSLPKLNEFCGWIKESCQTHTGIVEGTFYRDQGWLFYHMGRSIERADQTTRLVDVKYHILLPSPMDVGSHVDASQWNAVLRSAAGYHAFRRRHPRGMAPDRVVDFLLFDPFFPRSASTCLKQVAQLLTMLQTRYRLRGGNAALEHVDELQSLMADHTIDDAISLGLHEFIDRLQSELGIVTGRISQAFFGYTGADE
ncbi:MAG: alpha-E domain-containing protein [Pseudomonadota bacterium]